MNIRAVLTRFRETGFFHVFGGSVINKIVAFLTGVVMVRLLTTEEYGVFTYAWNIYSITILLDGLGAASAVLQMCSERGSDGQYVRQICNYGARFGLTFDIVIGAALAILGTCIPLPIDGAGELLRLLCALPALRLLFDLTVSCLRAQKRNRDYAQLNTLNTVVIFVLSAAGALLFREKGLILGYYGAYMVTVFLAFKRKNVPLISREKLPEQGVRRTFRSIAMISMCNTGLSQLLYLLDIFVLGIVDPQETLLASYRVATIIPSALTFIPISLITYVYPYFAEHKEDGAWCMRRFKQLLLGLGATNLLITVVLAASAPLVIQVFFGEAYAGVVPLFRLLAVNYCISGTFRIPAGNLLVTQRKLKFNLMTAILSGCVNIAADYLFITRWGAMGAAMATVLVVLITSVMNTGYLIYTFKKNAAAVS